MISFPGDHIQTGQANDDIEFNADVLVKGICHVSNNYDPCKDTLWFTKGWNESAHAFERNKMLYKHDVIEVIPSELSDQELQLMHDHAVFI